MCKYFKYWPAIDELFNIGKIEKKIEFDAVFHQTSTDSSFF